MLVLGVVVFRVPWTRTALIWVNDTVITVLRAGNEGARFLFGPLALNPGETAPGGSPSVGFILAAQVLPAVVFFASLMAALYHLRILQPIVKLFAVLFHKTMGLSGAESLAGSSNIFIGVATLATLMTGALAGFYYYGQKGLLGLRTTCTATNGGSSMTEPNSAWSPPGIIPRTDVVRLSQETLALPDLPVGNREDIFRIRALDMDWDIGTMTYAPKDPARVPKAPDGRKAGILLLHGGTSDYKSLEPVARMLAAKFGFKVTLMTFPGRLYLLDPSRDWPGDTLEPDGTGRTPLWTRETRITPDQYEVARDEARRASYGTVISLVAREGTEFYYRMAAWPVAFEEALRETCRREFPESEYSLYVHGHSTGGPFAMITAQRVANVTGVLGYGSSTFAYIYTAVTGDRWEFPFNHLRLRTWRDTARYLYEGLKDKGYGLPMLMELTMEKWEMARKRTNFKAEDFVHKNGAAALEQAARVTAGRLKMGAADEKLLVARYLGYLRELSGPDAKPVPPVLSLHGLNDDTVTLQRCQDSLSLYAAMDPAPKVACVSLGAGIHTWGLTYDDLPRGIIPPVCRLWHDAIVGGYFSPDP